MTKKYNYLLVGNSRLHWAEYTDNNYIFNHTLLNESLPKEIDFENLIWASVGDFPTNNLLKKNEVTHKDINIQNMPINFGIDRALACFAALRLIKNKSKKNLLIADLGTTLTITKIDYVGNLIGGQILPGFITQLKSLEINTKNLMFPENIYIPNNNFSLVTNEAMLRGVFNSLLGAINLSFNSKEDILILCGGDSELIWGEIKELNQEIMIKPNLVMVGMILSKKEF